MVDRPKQAQRVFLLVVDDSEEMRIALRYACRRAKSTGGRIALLDVTEPADDQHWAAVGDLMRQERRADAERRLQDLSTIVQEMTGTTPVLYVCEGSLRDELLKLLDEEPSISILVLGAGTGPAGPGPLVSALAGKMSGRLRVPLMIVPGLLSAEDIEIFA